MERVQRILVTTSRILWLQEIKAKYFDNDLRDHFADDYSTVGSKMALSILKNDVIPRFLKEEDLQALYPSEEPSNCCISKLQAGFHTLGLYQIGNRILNFLHFLRPSGCYALTDCFSSAKLLCGRH